MISADIVLRAPEFKPMPSKDGDAGSDLKVYLRQDAYDGTGIAPRCDFAETANERLDIIESFVVRGRTYVNGKYIESEGDLRLQLGEARESGEFIMIPPRKQFLFDVGFKLALYTDLPGKVAAMFVAPRSGLACKYLVGVANSPGIVDQGYRNWVGVCLENRGEDYHVFTHGSRIAQAYFHEVENVRRPSFWNEVEELPSSERGVGGFGSTGV